MKKLLALAPILLLLLSLAACAAEPQQAVGLSPEEAGIVADLPEHLLSGWPMERYYENTGFIRPTLSYSPSSELTDALNGYGDLEFSGDLWVLTVNWHENSTEPGLTSGLFTAVGVFQAYRKSDLAAGKAICVSFSEKPLYERPEASVQPTKFKLTVTKETVGASSYLFAETEDYYIFDWLPLIVGKGSDATEIYLNRCLYISNDYYNDGSSEDNILDTVFVPTMLEVLKLNKHIVFEQK